MGAFYGFLIFCVMGAAYFLPLIIANHRHLSDTVAIGFLNLFLGWTLIGWVVALCWASAGTAAKDSP